MGIMGKYLGVILSLTVTVASYLRINSTLRVFSGGGLARFIPRGI